MSEEFYQKLVDLYAGCELPEDLEAALVKAAESDPQLASEMKSLRELVHLLRSSPQPEFTEESNQRILMKLMARGVQLQSEEHSPGHMQYRLPIQG